MEIKPSTDLNPILRAGAPARKTAPGTSKGAAASFEASEALNQALATTPDIRADEVARARALVASEHYPPDVLVQKIARLLALEWDQSE